MYRQARSEAPAPLDALTLAAATWLACGIVLFGLTPLPLRDATLGWTPAFWLLVAPCVLLIARRAFRSQVADIPRHPGRSIQRKDAQAIRHRRDNASRTLRTRRAAA